MDQTTTATATSETPVEETDTRPDGDAILASLGRFTAVRDDLKTRVLGRSTVIDLAMRAVLAGEHMFQLGPAGTAKSLLMTEISRRMLMQDGSPATQFSWLLTRYTTPAELEGPISVAGLRNDRLLRVPTGRMPVAYFVFLDELFKGSSAILNSILRAINERVWYQDGIETSMPMITLFGASNEPPQENEGLEALYDRIIFRTLVGYLDDNDFQAMLVHRTRQTVHKLARTHAEFYGETLVVDDTVQTMTLQDLFLLQRALPYIEVPGPVLGALTQLRQEMKKAGIIVSDRRWAAQPGILQAEAMMQGRSGVEDEDLPVLAHTLWNKPEELEPIRKLLSKLVNPAVSMAEAKAQQASEIFTTFETAWNQASNKGRRVDLGGDAFNKLRNLRDEIKAIHEKAVASKMRNTKKIEDALTAAQGYVNKVSKMTVTF